MISLTILTWLTIIRFIFFRFSKETKVNKASKSSPISLSLPSYYENFSTGMLMQDAHTNYRYSFDAYFYYLGQLADPSTDQFAWREFRDTHHLHHLLLAPGL